MATASVTNTLVDGTTPAAAIWNTNYQDLVDFLNDDVVHRDGSKAMTGNLDLGGYYLDGEVFGYGPTSKADITLSAGAGSYQALHTMASIPAGTYLAIGSLYVESLTLIEDVVFTGHIERTSDGTTYAVSRVRQFGAVTGSATHLSPMTLVGLVTLTGTDTVRLRMARDVVSVSSGAQTAKSISLHLIPLHV